MRSSLIAALVACADRRLKLEAHRFLLGLSSDELQYIAEFLGACLLEPSRTSQSSRAQLAEEIAYFQRARPGGQPGRSADQEHKMILLLEYLCRGGLDRFSIPVRAHAGLN